MYKKLLIILLVCIMTEFHMPAGIFAGTFVQKKRIYITDFEKKGAVNDETAARVRDIIKITILEKYGEEYRIIADDDIRIMFKRAESLQAAGCYDESCNLDIAQVMNAQEIIYGNVSVNSGKITVKAYNLEPGTDEKRKGAGIKSMVSVSFTEKETEWMIREIALKLVDPKYRITRAPSFDESTKISVFRLEPLTRENITPITFERNESSLNAIQDHFKTLADEGDMLFGRSDYRKARARYLEIISLMNKKLTLESRVKMDSFIRSLNMRISSSLAMEYKEDIENIDKLVIPDAKPGEKDYRAALGKYKKIEKKIRELVPDGNSRLGIQKILNDRLDNVRLKLIVLKEKAGDDAYMNYKFNEALGDYFEAEGMAKFIRSDAVRSETKKILDLKMNLALSTGKSYFDNRVNSLIDQAEFSNVIEKKSQAKKFMQKARDYITGPQGKFASISLMNRYNDCAGRIRGARVIDETTRTEVYKKMADPLDERTSGDEFKDNAKECLKACVVTAGCLGMIVVVLGGDDSEE